MVSVEMEMIVQLTLNRSSIQVDINRVSEIWRLQCGTGCGMRLTRSVASQQSPPAACRRPIKYLKKSAHDITVF
ncbi:hypothetical protein M514_03242 [Trichuris suis]|uniref:Uncharacterized protein n=1 Tax=Trichuris suis TaxID=68888 RepID=A0A085MW11_9BILA|nr:hypothetical protein M513_03242 [Trichuris suis]KFD61407.1 hypothetical protein M514_03242 [Trichuris suis]